MLIKAVNFLSEYGDPEQFHELIMKMGAGWAPKYNIENPIASHHLNWKNPIGLAAGFDKNGEYLNELSQMGFGSLEVGTITPRPQAGNMRPRIKKINHRKSILNWMGFPSFGMDAVYHNLKKYKGDLPLGINIGKNKATANAKAIDDYLAVALKLKKFASYFTINISSPNTKGLRELQDKGFLEELLVELHTKNIKNIFIKIAPDLEDQTLKELASLATDQKLSGFISTNTTNQHPFDKGGLSGELLKERSYRTTALLKTYLHDAPVDIIACGGISHPEDLISYQKIGINLFQIYSSFVFHGPKILAELNKNLINS